MAREVKAGVANGCLIKMRNSTDGTSMTGLAHTDVSVYVTKYLGTSSLKSLVGADWIELDATNSKGLYWLKLSAAELSDVGEFAVTVMKSDAITFDKALNVVANIEADTYARIGAPVGASISADIAAGGGGGSTPAEIAAEVWSPTRDATLQSLSVTEGVSVIKTSGDALVLSGGGAGAGLKLRGAGGSAGLDVLGGNAGEGVKIGAGDGCAGVAVSGGAGALDIDAPNSDVGAAGIADAVFDEARSGHTIAGSFGEVLQALRSGTAQAGAASTITLDAGASSADDFYNAGLLLIVAGTGAGQARVITAYVGATRIATLGENWVVNPDATSRFAILPATGGAAPNNELSLVWLVNLALMRIGVADTILTLDDGSVEATVSGALIDAALDTVLAVFPWPFATKRALLRELEAVTRTGWSYVYEYPSDCVSPRYVYPGVRNPNSDFRVPFALEYPDSGDLPVLCCDIPNAELIYTCRVTNSALYSPPFVDAFAWFLAAEMAMPLAISPDLRDQATRMWEAMKGRAEAAAMTEGHEAAPASSLLSVRGAV